MAEIQEELDKAIRKMKSDGPSMFVIDSRKYPHARMRLLSSLMKRHKKGLFCGFNLSYDAFETTYSKLSNRKSLSYILKGDRNQQELPDVHYLGLPGSFSEISLLMNDLLNKEDFRFVFFENIHEISYFNGLEACKRFLNFVFQRLEAREIVSVATCVDGGETPSFVPYTNELFKRTDLFLSALIIGGAIVLFV